MTNSTDDSFKKNYTTLKNIADKLQKSDAEPNIDELVKDVEDATKAYNSCKERLDSVKKALDAYLPQNLIQESAAEQINTKEHLDDEIPF